MLDSAIEQSEPLKWLPTRHLRTFPRLYPKSFPVLSLPVTSNILFRFISVPFQILSSCIRRRFKLRRTYQNHWQFQTYSFRPRSFAVPSLIQYPFKFYSRIPVISHNSIVIVSSSITDHFHYFSDILRSLSVIVEILPCSLPDQKYFLVPSRRYD